MYFPRLYTIVYVTTVAFAATAFLLYAIGDFVKTPSAPSALFAGFMAVVAVISFRNARRDIALYQTSKRYYPLRKEVEARVRELLGDHDSCVLLNDGPERRALVISADRCKGRQYRFMLYLLEYDDENNILDSSQPIIVTQQYYVLQVRRTSKIFKSTRVYAESDPEANASDIREHGFAHYVRETMKLDKLGLLWADVDDLDRLLEAMNAWEAFEGDPSD